MNNITSTELFTFVIILGAVYLFYSYKKSRTDNIDFSDPASLSDPVKAKKMLQKIENIEKHINSRKGSVADGELKQALKNLEELKNKIHNLHSPDDLR